MTEHAASPSPSPTELWIYEQHSPDDRAGWRLRATLYSGDSPFQRVDVVDTFLYGRMLLLDGRVMTTEKDEFVYHEMVVHLPLFTHPDPRRVLIVGGGDGGALREAVKHPGVERVVMVEIDGLVVEKCREFLPTIAAAFDHPKAEVLIEDGIDYVRRAADASFDVVIVDGTDPIGPGVALFTPEFYGHIARILTPDGVVQSHASESCWYGTEEIAKTYHKLAGTFPHVRLFRADIPTYPSGTWYFCMGAKGFDPKPVCREERWDAAHFRTKYYSPEMHRAAYAIPPFVREGVMAAAPRRDA